jgi:hypothetical protein
VRHVAVVVEERDERGVVLHHPVGVLADHRRLHPVVQQLGRRAVHGGESVDVAAQGGLQILRGAEPAPEPTTVAEDDREQPQDSRDAGLVGELDPELGEVDLRLLAGGGLEATLEDLRPRRPAAADLRGACTPQIGPTALKLGSFKRHFWGDYARHSHDQQVTVRRRGIDVPGAQLCAIDCISQRKCDLARGE